MRPQEGIEHAHNARMTTRKPEIVVEEMSYDSGDRLSNLASSDDEEGAE